MKTKAALAIEAGKPLEIVNVNLDGPKDNEVLVEIMATGVCHTDEFTLSGADPEGIFPAILGHEGAGIVREVGPDVKSLKAIFYTQRCIIFYIAHELNKSSVTKCWRNQPYKERIRRSN